MIKKTIFKSSLPSFDHKSIKLFIEQLISLFPWSTFNYTGILKLVLRQISGIIAFEKRTAKGGEIDFLLEIKGKSQLFG